MSKLSKLLDRVSGRNRGAVEGQPDASSPSAGGEPYPNAPTTDGNGNSGHEGPRHRR